MVEITAYEESIQSKRCTVAVRHAQGIGSGSQARLGYGVSMYDQKAASRFAILNHDHPFLHWDLLLEDGDRCRTW